MKRLSCILLMIMLLVSSLSACARMSSVESETDLTNYELSFRGLSGEPIASDDYKSIKKVLEARFQAIGFINIVIELIDENIIRIQAQSKDDDIEMPEDIGKKGQITFQEVDAAATDDAGSFLPTGKIILDDGEVTSAEVVKDKVTGEDNIVLHLSEDGTVKFEEATARLIGNPIGIFIDDDMISAPIVNEAIKSSEVVITSSDKESIPVIVSMINTDSLPFELVPTESENTPEPDEKTQAEPTPSEIPQLTYPMYEVSKIMFETGFDGIAADPRFVNYTCDANVEHTLPLTSGQNQKVLYTYNENEISITIDGNKTIIDSIPKELLYDKVEIVLNEFEGDEWLEVHYLYRVAPDGICIGSVSISSSYSGYVEPYNKAVSYSVDDYLNLLGQKEEIITKELGRYADFSEDVFEDKLNRYLYDRLKIFAYNDEICALVVSGNRMFGRVWDTFTQDQVHYSRIEDFLGAKFNITSEKTKYFENVLDETLDYIKFEYQDYVLYFRLWGDSQDEIGQMVIIRKDFEGTLEDALLAMLG